MSRPFVPALLVLLAALLGSGCADDVAPAATVGDSIEISNDDLMSELAEWAASPTLIAQLQIAGTEGEGLDSYDTDFVDFLLTTRISFDLHNAQFDDLGLELTAEELANVRAALFADPEASAAVLDELSPPYADRLISDAARQFAVSEAMADGYQAWQVEAFTATDIQINPRYGTWSTQTASVVPPTGPTPAPANDLVPSP